MASGTEPRYSLADLAALVGLPARTVRYYIQLGLVDRPIGETRAAYYTDAHRDQLVAIARYSAEGLSLEAIGRLLKSPEGAKSPAEPVVGAVEVRSHLTVAPGIELVVEPGRAGLTPEQLKRLFRDVMELHRQIKENDDER